eukprot:11161543-Lingulodinium_polyedra.AAC.1
MWLQTSYYAKRIANHAKHKRHGQFCEEALSFTMRRMACVGVVAWGAGHYRGVVARAAWHYLQVAWVLWAWSL